MHEGLIDPSDAEGPIAESRAGTSGPRRWRRVALVVIAGYVAAAVLANTAMLLGMVGARAIRGNPGLRGESVPAIKHLRQVDARLLAGAQPTRSQYRGLRALGVRVVVDLRTGAPPDPRLDDPRFLRGLGMEYVWLPLTDGHAPDEATVRRFVGTVRRSEGLVYLHCGAGVGRSSSLQAAYEASEGRNPSVLAQLSIGPPSPEQLWFVARVGPGRPTAGNPAVRLVSRYVLDAPRTALNFIRGRI